MDQPFLKSAIVAAAASVGLGAGALFGVIDINIFPFKDTRYCGAPARDAAGEIKRRSDVLTAFQRQHPCPATGLTTGACAGYAIDHVIPLACGGCDAVPNLQWLPQDVKTKKDGLERRIYQHWPDAEPDTKACVFKITPP